MTPSDGAPAIVYFGEASKRPWYMRTLARGYSHCGVIIRTDISWIAVDPIANWTAVFWAAPWETPAVEVCHELLRRSSKLHTALALFCRVPDIREPGVEIHSCVTTTRRIIGIDRRWIVTPLQLYRALKRHDGLFYEARK